MTVQAPFLLMALVAVVAGLHGEHTVAAEEIGIVVGRNAFTFMAVIALFDRHFRILSMRYLFCVRLLLETHQGASQNRNHEKAFH